MMRKPLGVTLVVCLVLSGLANLRPVLAGTGPARGAQAPAGDYGDAPDGSLAGYAEPFAEVIGRFPTRFNTANSRLGLPGAHAVQTDQETLGLHVSPELDAVDLADPDGTINLVDEDRFDDSLRIGFDEADPPEPKTIDVVVTTAAAAPNIPRYVNVLIDLNHDGVWQQVDETEEWIVKNQAVTIAPGSSAVAVRIPFLLVKEASPTWMRVALTRTPIPEADFAPVGGWDGSGEFPFGEIEDHFLPVAGAIASAFVTVGAWARARASCTELVVALSSALAAAQANATAIAAACAQAQAHAQAAAVALAQARASAAAAAQAVAAAQALAAEAVSIISLIPCGVVVTDFTAVVSAMVSCVVAAQAQADAQAEAAAAAFARADAEAQACAAASAEAAAAVTAIANALTAAQASAQAIAGADAQARAAAQAAAQAIAVGGRSAYASAMAQAFAAVRASAFALTACQTLTAAFASAQASVQASFRFLAFAEVAARFAFFAAFVAQFAAQQATNAQAAAGATAQTGAMMQTAVTTLLNRDCLDDVCEGITAITLLSFTATARAAKVQLVWETGTEVNNAGFHLYRATAPDGPYTKITGALIAARGDAVSGARYSFVDEPGSGTFYYKLDDVTLNGRHTFHGPVRVSVRL